MTSRRSTRRTKAGQTGIGHADRLLHSVAIPNVTGPAPAQRQRLLRLLVALATGGIFASLSLIASVVVVRLALGPNPGSTAFLVVALTTAVGAGAGSWFSQPTITRAARRGLADF